MTRHEREALIQADALHSEDLARLAARVREECIANEQTATAAFEWLNSECYDLRAEDVRYHDDADVIWRVYSHHMTPPKLRIEGQGSTALQAVRDAMLPKDDPRRSDYQPTKD